MAGKFFVLIIKRYKGMFISMVIVSALAVAMLTGFTSIVRNTDSAFENFKNEYGIADITFFANSIPKKNIDKLNSVKGVESVNGRLAIPAYLDANKKLSTAMVCTYNESDFSKHYVIKETKADDNAINVSLEKRYAENNKLKVGDKFDMYFYGTKIACFVEKIVYTPETIYVLANEFMKPDNTGFGYVFLSADNYVKVVKEVNKKNSKMSLANASDDLVENGISNYNQVLIKCKDGYDVKTVMAECKDELGIKINKKMTYKESPTAKYMLKCIKTFNRLAIVMPAFFYLVMLLIVSIFLNQIVIYLTTDIGTMTALGTKKSNITSSLSTFALSISAGALIVGYAIGKILSIIGAELFGNVYQIPNISTKINISFIILAVFLTAIVGQIAVFIASRKVFKITPRDAMINNETNKANIPKFLSNSLKNKRTNTALNLSIVFHNPRRIVASILCVIMATAIMTFSLCFETSEDLSIEQATNGSYAFDMHYLCADGEGEQTYGELLKLNGVNKIEKIHYATMTMKNGDKKIKMNVCGMIKGCTMFKLPDEKGELGNVKVEGDGIWLNKDYAKELGVEVGDSIEINGKRIKVNGLAYQYLEKISAMSEEQLFALTNDYQTGYMMKISDRNALDEYVLKKNQASVINEIDDIKVDLDTRLQGVDIMLTVVMLFSIIMSILIITMMTQASIMEQKRLISTMRTLGFSIGNISTMWIKQEIVFFVIGAAIGLPLGLIAEKISNKMLINDSWSFPFVCDRRDILIAVGFVALILLIAHFFSIKIVKKWNLADNMRSRE